MTSEQRELWDMGWRDGCDGWTCDLTDPQYALGYAAALKYRAAQQRAREQARL